MNFLQCYQMLDLEPGCSWTELQQAYRRLVQKWHPDRYQDHPEQHHLAAQRILELNEAFETLSQHYTRYGHLPGEPVPSQRPVPPTEPKRSRSARRVAPAVPGMAAGKTPRWLLSIALLVLGYALYLGFSDHTAFEQPAPDRSLSLALQPTEMLEIADADPAPATESPAPAVTAPLSPPAPIAFFTRGDTPGKVIEVQGIPTRTAGDVWFYGASEVHFSKGVVVSWYDSPKHPLKVAGAAGNPEKPDAR